MFRSNIIRRIPCLSSLSSRYMSHFYLHGDGVETSRLSAPADLSEKTKMEISSLYHSMCVPQPTSASFANGLQSVNHSYRDLAQDQYRSFSHNYVETEGSFAACGFPVETTGSVYQSKSPSGKKYLVIKSVDKASLLHSSPSAAAPVPPGYAPSHPGNSSGKCYVLEVYSSTGLLHSVIVEQQHGRIFTGVPFGSPVWSPCETQLAYCAEPALKATSRSWLTGLYTDATAEEATKDPLSYQSPHQHVEGWGEQLDGAVHPSIYLAYLHTGKISCVASFPSQLAICQPQFVPSATGYGLVCTIFPKHPRTYGLIYYSTRPCAVVGFHLPEEYDAKVSSTPALAVLSGKDLVAQNPMLVKQASGEYMLIYSSSPISREDAPIHGTTTVLRKVVVGKTLPVFTFVEQTNKEVAKDASGVYQNTWDFTHLLFSYKANTTEPSTLVPAPDSYIPYDRVYTEQPGLCLGVSDTHHTLVLDNTLVLSTCVRSVQRLFFLRLAENRLYNVELPNHILKSEDSIQVLNIEEGKVVISITSTLKRPTLYVLTITEAMFSNTGAVITDKAIPLQAMTPEYKKISASNFANPQARETSVEYKEDVRTVILQVPIIDEGNTSSMTSECIVSYDASTSCSGVVLFPHGGPCSSFHTNYDFVSHAMVRQGYAVVMVNYRGSSCFGQQFLDSLTGHIGTVDTNDCLSSLDVSLKHLSSVYPDLKPETLPKHLFGGSHGGYLVGMLAGAHPDTFSSVVSRNPVLSQVFTSATSDIPDWCYAEAGRPFHPSNMASPQDLQHFYSVSPYKFLDQYKTPTLLQIGTNDKRVPPQQSYEFYRILQMKGVPSNLLTYYNAQHGLQDKPSIHADSIISSIAWFKRFHTNPNKQEE